MSRSYAEPRRHAPPMFSASFEKLAEMVSYLGSAESFGVQHGELEGYLRREGCDLLRRMLQEHLDARAEAEQRVSVLDASGVARPHLRRSQERQLETLFGTVTVKRYLYQAPGQEGLAPADAHLNLASDQFSHGVRCLIAYLVASGSYEEVVDHVQRFSGAQVAKRQVEECAIRAAQDFDEFYASLPQEHCAEAEELVVISTDAKGIVVRHQDLRAKTRQRAERNAHKLATRLAPGEKRARKRMAQVCAVYWVKPWVRSPDEIVGDVDERRKDRPRPQQKRVWASVKKPSKDMIAEAFDEALRRDPEHQHRWVVLVDGDPRQLKRVKSEARRVGAKVTIVVDIVHVLEYLWQAARALFSGSTPDAEVWVGNRLAELLNGRRGGDVARTIRRWRDKREEPLSSSELGSLNEACDYLTDRKRTRIMRYDLALAEGFPIATGIIEGACRYLVKDRMDRTGARWSLDGADAVLRLRALRASGDFDEYFRFHLRREFERIHASRYMERTPPPHPHRIPDLRLVA